MTTPFLRLGLIGFPLSHSRSPAIQTAALQAAGLAGEYLLYPVEPLPQGEMELRALIMRLRAAELDGLNVTVPHKQSVLPLVDQLTPLAAAIGAVNTLYRQGDQIWGDNTDAPGFLADLYHLAPALAQAKLEAARAGAALQAVILGAGGSARAVAHALLSDDWKVAVAARNITQAQTLVTNLQRCAGLGIPLPDASKLAVSLSLEGLQALLDQAPVQLVVNTTPVGMASVSPGQSLDMKGSGSFQSSQSAWPDGLAFPPGSIVYDLVYNPPETELMRQARQAGLLAFNGLGMLVEQAALSFETWTGRPAPRTPMRQAVEIAHL